MLILCAKAAATVVLQNIAMGICYATRGLITDGGENVLSGNKGEGVGLEEGLDFSSHPVACRLYANRALALSEEQCGGRPPKKPKPKPPKQPTPFPCNKYS
jgi:hypothetical protein